MTPFPGTVDFVRWEKEQAKHPTLVGDVPITRYWLIPTDVRPKMFTPHPSMNSDEIGERTQKVWDTFYTWSDLATVCLRSTVTVQDRFCVPFEALPADVCGDRNFDR